MDQAEYDAFAQSMAKVCLQRKDMLRQSLSNLEKSAEKIMVTSHPLSLGSARNISDTAEKLFTEMAGYAHYTAGVRDTLRILAHEYNLKENIPNTI